MEFSRKHFGQWGFLLLIIVGVFLYRSLFQTSGGAVDPQALATRQTEMQDLWYRIPSYPGSKAPVPKKEATRERIVWERLQATTATYDEARSFYDKELLWVGWDSVGEVKQQAGFSGPIYVYRSGDYHLLLNREPQGILLRMTWSADLDLLIESRVRE